MDSMIIILVAFISAFIAVFCVVFATTIRKLREEVNKLKEENWKLEHDYYNLKEQLREKVAKLKEENTKLKDENHSLSCSEKSLLWQREQLRQEIVTIISDSNYFFGRQALMHSNFTKVEIFDKKGMPLISYKKAWEIAVKMIYNWS